MVAHVVIVKVVGGVLAYGPPGPVGQSSPPWVMILVGVGFAAAVVTGIRRWMRRRTSAVGDHGCAPVARGVAGSRTQWGDDHSIRSIPFDLSVPAQ